ncbi:MAG: hypothetical protein U1E70_16625 [Acetobacteraceae bacterium]
MSDTADLIVPPRTRDALAVLAYIFLQFDRAADAAALLAALARLDVDASWAGTTRCLALVMAGQDEAALQEAGVLLDTPLEDSRRGHLLRIMARACWNLGRSDEARQHQEAAKAVLAAMVMRDREALHP